MNLDIAVKMQDVKNIHSFEYTFRFERGIYTLVGENAVGKSTIMAAIASTIYPKILSNFGKTEANPESNIEISCKNEVDRYTYDPVSMGIRKPKYPKVVFNGIYEGSIFSGTRFADMKNIDEIIQTTPEFINELIPASNELKDALSFILHNEPGHYDSLYKFSTFKIAQKYGLENMPYFLKLSDGQYISKYKMSSGECFLISLLNFIISTALKPKYLKNRKKVISERMFIFVDEVELALHPSSILRLVTFLEDMISKNDLTVLFSTHSSELIRRVSPKKIFYLENYNGTAKITSPCYPQYAIRSLYDHDGYDSTILVEDVFTESIIRRLIQDFRIQNNLLVNVVPVGAWNNTLSFQKRAVEQNAFGRDRFIFSVIDGDVENEVNKSGQYKTLKKLFLPIKSGEKYLYQKFIESIDINFIKIIGNKYFTLEPLDSILKECRKNVQVVKDKTGKKLFDVLCKHLESVGLDEQAFIKSLCEDIFSYENFNRLKNNIEQFIENNFCVAIR